MSPLPWLYSSSHIYDTIKIDRKYASGSTEINNDCESNLSKSSPFSINHLNSRLRSNSIDYIPNLKDRLHLLYKKNNSLNSLRLRNLNQAQLNDLYSKNNYFQYNCFSYVNSNQNDKFNMAKICQKRKKGIKQKSIRSKAKSKKINVPNISDINIIDKYSRMFFPSLFLIFNLIYFVSLFKILI